MPLDFFRFGWYPVLTVRVFEPSTWSEDFGVLAPERGGAVHGCHRDHDQRALGDRQAVDELAMFRADGFRERDDIVFDGLWTHDTSKGGDERSKWGTYHANDLAGGRVEAEDLVDDGVEIEKTV